MKYIEDKNFKFYCQISPNGYDHKPTEQEAAIIQNSIYPTMVSIDDFVSKIKNGAAYRAGEKTKDTFTVFQIVSLDIDGCPTPMREYIEMLHDKPTIAYTSPSNGILECKKEQEEGIYRFRLVYVSNKNQSGYSRYNDIRNYLVNANGMTHTDSKSYPAVHYFNGNAKSNVEVYVSGCIYDFSDIETLPIKSQLTLSSRKGFEETCRSKRSEHPSNLYDELVSLGVNPEFAHDCGTLEFVQFLNKWFEYIHPTIKRIKFSSDYMDGIHPYAVVAPDNYKSVLRCQIWDSSRNHKVDKKWHDGQNRHGKIFYSSKVIKDLNPWLTIEQFIYWTVNEYVSCYYNMNKDGGEKYTLASFIKTITLKAWHAVDSGLFIPKHPKIHVKDEAIEITGKTKKQLAPTVASDLRRIKIMRDYDPSISIKKNLEKYKDRGIKVSLRTLKRYRKKQNNDQNSSQTNLTGINPALISTQVDSPPTTSGIPDGGS